MLVCSIHCDDEIIESKIKIRTQKKIFFQPQKFPSKTHKSFKVAHKMMIDCNNIY